MNVGKLIEILSEYPKETDIKVLEKLRSNGAGSYSNILGLINYIDQDTNKGYLCIETDDEDYIDRYEKEAPYNGR
ncbi:hypothetical protein [Clostridium beijerinckii]|uniref:hypothetical protein n=1 Tax=Clostridium beijerinckii TaxID=1520 RepID=UPI00098C306F|nr:hypothetical protein [Clostridium beijerinckii]MBA8937817.1 hypothetical protein [Clostridium beijerinckii]NRU41682.1 hypothetical protein [Clostridium beijerinckii]NSB00887.1 hypothetical protein [Clostridium beijerinckii]OOM59911.1 hypothetical protein CLOBI_32940 [Clostridium beijerinckii]OOM64850.1 hypothetical protein CLBEIC_54300 [Clostridium beijerinckii]